MPKYVTEQADGFRVGITRGKMRFRAYVSKSKPGALEEAVRIRDQFLAAAGPVLVPTTHALPADGGRISNTGIRGITETVKWTRYRPHPCFWVSLGARTKRFKRIYYGPKSRTREQALRIAVAIRSSFARATEDRGSSFAKATEDRGATE